MASAWYDRDLWVAGRMFAQSYANETYFLHANELHSDAQVTDHSGAGTLDLLYYPWGQIWTHTGYMSDAHFAGFEQGASDLYATPTRHYSNDVGRWLSPDPLGGDIMNPQSLPEEVGIFDNRYAYVLNNPTTLTDPLGLVEPPGCDPGAQCVLVVGTPPPPIYISGGNGGLNGYLGYGPTPPPLVPPFGGRGGGAPPKPNIITWPQLQKLVHENSESNFCDDLIDCIVFKESTVPGGFDANAPGKPYRYRGVPQQARGLMQVTQGGASVVNNVYHLPTSGSALYQGLSNPAINVQVGSDLLQYDYEKAGSLNLWQALNDYGGSKSGAYTLDVLRCVEQLQEGSFAGAEGAAHGR